MVCVNDGCSAIDGDKHKLVRVNLVVGAHLAAPAGDLAKVSSALGV